MLTLAVIQSYNDMLLEAITLMVVGMLVVFGALIALQVVIAGISKAGAEKPKPQAAPAPTAAAPKSVPADQLDPQLVVVLAAAATAALNRPVHIERVTFLGQQTGGIWAQLGRRSIMTSHRPYRGGRATR